MKRGIENKNSKIIRETKAGMLMQITKSIKSMPKSRNKNFLNLKDK